jgi:hypothetical protein
MNSAGPFLAQHCGVTAMAACRAQRPKARAVAHLAEPAGAAARVVATILASRKGPMAGEQTNGGMGTRRDGWAVEEPTRRMGHRQGSGAVGHDGAPWWWTPSSGRR